LRGMPWAAIAITMAGAAACGSPDAASQAPPSAEQIAAGQAAYRANGCAVCHGRDGRGDGPTAGSLRPRPPDFTDASFAAGRTVETVAAVIASGVAAMPAFGHLDAPTRRHLAVWILSRASSDDDVATKEQQ